MGGLKIRWRWYRCGPDAEAILGAEVLSSFYKVTMKKSIYQ